jgi:hypothetical protein
MVQSEIGGTSPQLAIDLVCILFASNTQIAGSFIFSQTQKIGHAPAYIHQLYINII